MTKRIAVFLMLTLLSGLPSFAADHAAKKPRDLPQDLTVTFDLLEARNPDVTYTIAIIQPKSRSVVESPEHIKLARALVSIANDWSVDWYIDRHPDVPREKFEEMRAKGIQFNKNSALIMAFQGNDPYKMAGTLLLSYPERSGKIDLETALNWEYPRSPIKRAPYPYLDYVHGQLNKVDRINTLQWGVIELKRFVIDPGNPHDLMPALILRGDKLSTQTIREVPQKALPPNDLGRNNPLWAHQKFQLAPSEYALRCDQKLCPIYRRMGFKYVQDEPIKGDYIMRQTREEYVQMETDWLRKVRAKGWSTYFENTAMGVYSPQIEKAVSASLEESHRCRRQILRTIQRLTATPDANE